LKISIRRGKSKFDLPGIAKIIYYDDALLPELPVLNKWKTYEELTAFNEKTDFRICVSVLNKVQDLHPELKFGNFDYRRLNWDLKEKVKPFLKTLEDEELLINRIARTIAYGLEDLPF